MNPDIKERAQEVANKLGFSLEEKPSQYLIDSIKRAERDIREGNVSPGFKSGKEAVEWLAKQGI